MASTTVPDIKCLFENNDKIFIEKDGVNKVVCTSDGRVVEMFNENVLSTCDIQLKNPSQISVFYSYEPFVKHYIVSEDKKLVIIKKEDGNMKVFRTYENVQEYKVADFLVVGRPQVKIWFFDEMEPFITDFSDNKLNNLNDRREMQNMSDLNRKLHLMRSSLIGINKVLVGRKLMLENYFKQLNNDTLIHLYPEPWQRIVNGRWVICVHVCSKHDFSIKNLHLIINNNSICEIETKIFHLTTVSTKEFFSKNKIDYGHNACAIGIVDLSYLNFLKDDINLSCSLLYNLSAQCGDDSIKECKIPPFIIRIKDLIDRSIDVFITNDRNLSEDIIPCTAVNEVIVLELQLLNGVDITQLTDILINKLQFIKYQDFECIFCYVVKPLCNSMLSGLIVYVENVSETVTLFACYPKYVHQVEMLKGFLQLFCKDVLISKRKSGYHHETRGSILAAVNTLDDEFKHFTSVVRSAIPSPPPALPLKEENNLKFTVEMWKGLMESTVQFNTDLQFQSALVEEINNVNVLPK